MQHAAALVPPDAAAAQEIGIEHADGGLTTEQVRGRGRPVHPPLVGVEGLPVGQRRQAAEVHAAMGRGAQPHHLAGGARLVEVAVAVVAQAHEGLGAARPVSSTMQARRGSIYLWPVRCWSVGAVRVSGGRLLRQLHRAAVALQVGLSFCSTPGGIGQIPARRTRRIHQVPVLLRAAGRQHHGHMAAELQQQGREPRHRLAATGIGIGPEADGTASQGTPIHAGDGLAATAPAHHHVIGKQRHGGIGRLLPLGDQHRSPEVALQLR